MPQKIYFGRVCEPISFSLHLISKTNKRPMKQLIFSLAFLTLTLSCSESITSADYHLDPDLYGEWHYQEDPTDTYIGVLVFSSNGMVTQFGLNSVNQTTQNVDTYEYWVEGDLLIIDGRIINRYSVSGKTLEVSNGSNTFAYTRQ